eukprot:UN26020
MGLHDVGLLCFIFLFPYPKNEARTLIDGTSKDSIFNRIKHDGWGRTWVIVKNLYTDTVVQLWTLWFLFGYCASNIVSNYYQNQFYEIDPNGKFGYVECVLELVCTLMALLPIYITLDNYQPQLLCVTSLIQAAIYYSSTVFQESVYYSYTFQISAYGIYCFQTAMAYATIARRVED